MSKTITAIVFLLIWLISYHFWACRKIWSKLLNMQHNVKTSQWVKVLIQYWSFVNVYTFFELYFCTSWCDQKYLIEFLYLPLHCRHSDGLHIFHRLAVITAELSTFCFIQMVQSLTQHLVHIYKGQRRIRNLQIPPSLRSELSRTFCKLWQSMKVNT